MTERKTEREENAETKSICKADELEIHAPKVKFNMRQMAMTGLICPWEPASPDRDTVKRGMERERINEKLEISQALAGAGKSHACLKLEEIPVILINSYNFDA
ncbi:hypothetical protein RvY_17027 [Ramazzottius varieornatus]|uniref:Uncharacterized protein n=1 Tax=Ramazzottius varieornatus TaxID=947166 RepID=A0A1D1W0N5_RAMVA|nr:hypothetical protein RvY_17027 [Ramazzottius varieornatus]